MADTRVAERLETAWRAFRESYAGLSDAELLEPGVAGNWSVRDVLAHVTTWEEEALTHLPVILAGGRPPRYADAYGGIDAFNARTTEAKRALSLAEVRQEQERVHRRLLDYVAGVPTGTLEGETRFRRRLRLDTYGHYRHHAAAIRRWRVVRSAGQREGRDGKSVQRVRTPVAATIRRRHSESASAGAGRNAA